MKTTHLWTQATGTIAALFFFATAIGAQPQPDEALRMERAVELRAAGGSFMGAVLVARDGKPVISKGYGPAHLKSPTLNTPRTRFRLGSVTKQFTAASVLLLAERGKLKLEDPISKHIVDAPVAWKEVTVLHLLNHTSGIANYTDFPDYSATKGTPVTPVQLVARFRDKPLDFPPGTRFNYSNSGYALLGLLIERASGRTYAEFVRDNIFVPLQMNDSGYAPSNQGVEGHASGHGIDMGGVAIPAPFIDMSIPFAAGALHSTAEDMLRWQVGLFNGKLLSADSLRRMTTPYLNGYGLGVAVGSEPDGDQVISHRGGIEGFNSRVTYVPADRLTVIVLANLNGRAADDIATDLLKIARNETTQLDADQRRSEAMLRASVSGIAEGKPLYDQMVPEFAGMVRGALAQLQATLATWGAIREMSFKGVGPLGQHLYEVTFDNAKLRGMILLAPDGKIQGHVFAPLQ